MLSTAQQGDAEVALAPLVKHERERPQREWPLLSNGLRTGKFFECLVFPFVGRLTHACPPGIGVRFLDDLDEPRLPPPIFAGFLRIPLRYPPPVQCLENDELNLRRPVANPQDGLLRSNRFAVDAVLPKR